MKRLSLALLLSLALTPAAGALPASAAAEPSAVTPWIEFELGAMAEEAAVSRLYAGIHFSSDNEAGLELGRRVGGVAVRAYGASAP